MEIILNKVGQATDSRVGVATVWRKGVVKWEEVVLQELPNVAENHISLINKDFLYARAFT